MPSKYRNFYRVLSYSPSSKSFTFVKPFQVTSKVQNRFKMLVILLLCFAKHVLLFIFISLFGDGLVSSLISLQIDVNTIQFEISDRVRHPEFRLQ